MAKKKNSNLADELMQDLLDDDHQVSPAGKESQDSIQIDDLSDPDFKVEGFVLGSELGESSDPDINGNDTDFDNGNNTDRADDAQNPISTDLPPQVIGAEQSFNDEIVDASGNKAKESFVGDINNDEISDISASKVESFAEPYDESTMSGLGSASTGTSPGVWRGTEAALVQSESLKAAQKKITDLENEVNRLREENEALAVAGETMRERADELLAQFDSQQAEHRFEVENFEQEKGIIRDSLEGKKKEIEKLKSKVDELETRLSTHSQKVRMRERELENRLELVKMEGSALLRSKDEQILDLKRQLDQVEHEIEGFRMKSQELNRNVNEKQDVIRRTVKALRLALSLLEGETEEQQPFKKAE